MSLIHDILDASKRRLADRKAKRPYKELKTRASRAPRARYSFLEGIAGSHFGLIAEVKRRSPTAGDMNQGNVERALAAYTSCPSVCAISILTDVDHFGGSIEDLAAARRRTDKPILRKDFIVDDYQVLEARAFGADAILLMAGLFQDPGRPRALFQYARDLGMDVLFEIGMSIRPIDDQVKLIPADAPIWGINSRQFSGSVKAQAGRALGKELSTSLTRHHDLYPLVPAHKLVVAESGIESPDDLTPLAALGYRAALIGTAFLKNGAAVEDRLNGFDEQLQRSARLSQAVPAAIAAR